MSPVDRVRFLRPAEVELVSAARFYESRAPGLGDAFLDKVDAAIRDIAEAPERWPVLQSGVRRRLLHRFPYGLLYRVDPDAVVVLAVMHLRRHPTYWLDRS